MSRYALVLVLLFSLGTGMLPAAAQQFSISGFLRRDDSGNLNAALPFTLSLSSRNPLLLEVRGNLDLVFAADPRLNLFLIPLLTYRPGALSLYAGPQFLLQGEGWNWELTGGLAGINLQWPGGASSYAEANLNLQGETPRFSIRGGLRFPF
ncbi:MAG TPA: hypothetical protein VFS50_12280 [Meiothermus sp.]|nr:hypothetical protein [Meiothermus sp.]